MKKCKDCMSEIDDKAKKCSKCGSDQRSWFRRHPIITGFLVLVILGIFGSVGSSDISTTSTKTNTDKVSDSVAVMDEEKEQAMEVDDSFPHFGDGMLVVGEDIEPGTYRTRKGSSGCYYARLGGFSGALGDVLSNNNTDAPAVVTISEADAGFQSTRCGTWTQDLSQITESTTEFEDGMFIVGTDIEPGTYKSTGQSGCYYARVSGFTGGLGEILANNNTDTSAIVTIASTDKGFISSRCGTWEKQ